MEFLIGIFGIKSEFEKIVVNKLATRVCGKLRAQRNHSLLMPFDNGLEVIDNAERFHRRKFQRGASGVAETQATNNDIQFGIRKTFFGGGQSEI